MLGENVASWDKHRRVYVQAAEVLYRMNREIEKNIHDWRKNIDKDKFALWKEDILQRYKCKAILVLLQTVRLFWTYLTKPDVNHIETDRVHGKIPFL